MDRCPSSGGNCPTPLGPEIGFRCGDVGGNINEEEFEEIFCPDSDSEPSPVSTTSWIASRDLETGIFGVVSVEGPD